MDGARQFTLAGEFTLAYNRVLLVRSVVNYVFIGDRSIEPVRERSRVEQGRPRARDSTAFGSGEQPRAPSKRVPATA